MQQYKKAMAITIVSGVLLFAVSYFIGTNNFFLLLNCDGGNIADFFFHYFTYLGDGIFWVPVIILTFIYRKNNILLVVAAIISSTLFTHLFKDWLMAGEPRPIKAIADLTLVHIVKGVELHSIGSFPSGHTTTAFCFYLIACLFFKNKWILIVGFIIALLVGYSRIYLAQHFARDVAGGMLAAALSIFVSLYIQRWWALQRK